MVLVVEQVVLLVVVEHVTIYVNLLIVRINVLYHVVTLHVPEKQVMIVMVLCVIPVVAIVVAETVKVVHVLVDVVLMDVIPHVIIGAMVYVKVVALLNHRYVELLLVRPQTERKHKNSFNKIKRGKRLCK